LSVALEEGGCSEEEGAEGKEIGVSSIFFLSLLVVIGIAERIWVLREVVVGVKGEVYGR